MLELFSGILGSIVGYYVIKLVIPIMIATALTIWARMKNWAWLMPFVFGLSVFTFLIVVMDKLVPPMGKPQMVIVKKSALSGMTGFIYEEIIIPTDRAVGLDSSKLKLMESSPGYRYSARIEIKDSEIAWLDTGDSPTILTKQTLYPESGLTLDSLIEMKQFSAISIRGKATLCVTYYREEIK